MHVLCLDRLVVHMMCSLVRNELPVASERDRLPMPRPDGVFWGPATAVVLDSTSCHN